MIGCLLFQEGDLTFEILRESLSLRLLSEVKLVSFLSVGIDSRSFLALMALESIERVKTFSFGFDEQEFS